MLRADLQNESSSELKTEELLVALNKQVDSFKSEVDSFDGVYGKGRSLESRCGYMAQKYKVLLDTFDKYAEETHAVSEKYLIQKIQRIREKMKVCRTA